MRISDWRSDVCSSDLAEGDGAELGLRALARAGGVSATALYRHFPDKEAPLDALADEGLRRSDERRAGKACVSTCRARRSPKHQKKNISITVHHNIRYQSNYRINIEDLQ